MSDAPLLDVKNLRTWFPIRRGSCGVRWATFVLWMTSAFK